MKAKCIMVQGTASSVGKSLITAGLCRIFMQDGYNVTPFKSQNMALNSYITREGKEMGRAQVVQAEAAGKEPVVAMNPVLIKPTADTTAQVIVNGEVYGNMSAMEYHNFKPKLAEMIRGIYDGLAESHDIVVIEGAGSPAEINLRENDIVNMGMAEIADAPVILVGDIDKGGVFASIAGTLLLLTEKEKARVKGVIINKFRGDLDILKPGMEMLEEIIKIPVLGVLPHMSLNIDDEDGFLAEKYSNIKNRTEQEHGKNTTLNHKEEIDIAVIKYPYLSNDTDFNTLENVPGVSVRFVKCLSDIAIPDLIILPGSKNTISDLLFLRSSGLEEKIKSLNSRGIPVFGICGGFQMLGMEISDPFHTETEVGSIKGMGLLNTHTVFREKKTTTQVEAVIIKGVGLLEGLEGFKVKGYEIHMGKTGFGEGCTPYLMINNILGEETECIDGTMNDAGDVFGTYIHGIFDSTDFTTGIINNLRRKRGLAPLSSQMQQYSDFKENEYNRLASAMRTHIDINAIYEIIKGK